MGKIACAVTELRSAVDELRPRCMDGDDAAALLEWVFEGKNLLGAAETLLVNRVDECRIAQRDGHRSTAEWLATRSGTSVGHARDVVETAARLDECPATEAALRDGRISTEQAREITSAANVDPGAEAWLLESASVDGLPGLRDKSRRVQAAAIGEAELAARHQRIHDERYHRRWNDREGAACGQYRTTPEAAARFWAELDAERDRIYKEARAEGGREPFEAYEADALCALGERDARSHRGTRMTAILHADIPPVMRGATEPGEICEIAGIGPVPVAVAREQLGDALLKIVITHGQAVRTVVHPNRTVAAAIRTALLWEHRECSVAGCHEVHGLQAHHTVDFAESGHTRLDELTLICARHHDLITHRGFTLEPRPDAQFNLTPPGHTVDDRIDDERGPPIAA